MSRQPALRVRNRLLSALPAPVFKRIASHFEAVAFKQCDVLYKAAAPIEFVVFPEDCVLSAITGLKDDHRIEVGTIGNEGASGLLSFLKPTCSPHEVLVQIDGQGIRIAADVLRRELKSSPRAQDLLFRHHEAFVAQLTQSVACNGLHSINQRCCRWLLMTHDRVRGDELSLTHDFLAFMLGVRRAGVTVTLAALEKKRLIKNGRGAIIIANRTRLETTACECYSIVVKEYERLLGTK